MSELLTVQEVADALRVDHNTVRRWARQGVLEVITLPHRGTRQGYRIKRETLEKILGNPPTTENGNQNEWSLREAVGVE